MNEVQSNDPVRLEVDYPEHPSRALAACGILWFVKPILLLPHLVLLWFVSIVAIVLVWVAYWVVLFTGKYPRGMFDFAIGWQRWHLRTGLWILGAVDRYPSFSMK